jgi:hypothetical protein
MPTLSYAIKHMYNFSNIETIIKDLLCILLILKYGIIFSGNSTDIKRVTQLQKKTMRTMMGVNSTGSCTPIVKALKICIISAQYTLSLMTILAHDFEYFAVNNLIHSVCARRLLQLHKPVKNLALYQTGVYYKSIKISNILPKCIADLLKDMKQSVQSLRSILIEESFNSIDEFLDYCVTQCSGCVMKNSSLCM